MQSGKFLLTAVALQTAIAFSLPAYSDTVTLRADNWCPFNCDPADPKPGYMIEIVKAALEPLGHKIDYATLNWARAISETRTGAFGGIVGAAKNDAPDFVFPDSSLGISKTCFYAKADSKWEYKGPESLKAVKLGIIKDYAYEESLDTYIKANAKDSKLIDVVAGDNPLELNIKKVTAGRIGAFAEDQNVAGAHIYAQKLTDKLKNVGCIPEETPLYIAFGPKTPKAADYAKAISAKVDAMRKDGSLKTLLEKYGLKDWKS